MIRSVIQNIFGVYTPIESEFGEWSPDMEWILYAVIFVLFLSFLFRLIINLLKK